MPPYEPVGCRNIALRLEYDGTLFHGWQSQTNAEAVQDIVARALSRLEGGGARVRVTGASRTDAGVHAIGQVANFHTASGIPAEKYFLALNTLLPQGLCCTASKEVPPDFHARFSATGKQYAYRILNRPAPSALLRDRAWHVPARLDAAAMREAAACLRGKQDFAAFMAAGSPVASTVRTVWELDLASECGGRGGAVGLEGLLALRVAGDGFLYNMVRIIAGTLVYVGLRKLAPQDIPEILRQGRRELAGVTAPAHGLCLEKVFYGGADGLF